MEVYECFGVSITVSLCSPLDPEVLFFWMQRFCPNVKKSNATDHAAAVICRQNAFCAFAQQGTQYELCGDWTGSESALARFLCQVFQTLLVSRGILFLRAACVSDDSQNAALLVGDVWQGKTAVASALHTQYGLQIVSDNCVAVSQAKILGYCRFLSFRSELLDAGPKAALMHVNNRSYFSADTDCLTLPLHVRTIVVPHINCGRNDFWVISKQESVWYLYAKLSQCFGGAILCNGTLAPPSIIDEAAGGSILAETNRLLDAAPICYAAAESSVIAEKIYSLLTAALKS